MTLKSSPRACSNTLINLSQTRSGTPCRTRHSCQSGKAKSSCCQSSRLPSASSKIRRSVLSLLPPSTKCQTRCKRSISKFTTRSINRRKQSKRLRKRNVLFRSTKKRLFSSWFSKKSASSLFWRWWRWRRKWSSYAKLTWHRSLTHTRNTGTLIIRKSFKNLYCWSG